MPQIYYLNPPPNPFWDFVTGLEDHPLLQGPPRHQPRGRFARYGPAPPPPGPTQSTTEPAQPELSERAQGKQPHVEDPPEVDPSTIKSEAKKSEDNEEGPNPRFCGRGRFAHAFDGDNDNDCRRSRGGHGRRCGGRGGARGPPMFPFGRPPWAFQAPPMPPNPAGVNAPAHGPAGVPPVPPHHRGPYGPHGPHGLHRRPSPPGERQHRGPYGGFDLGGLLNNLGNKLGVDLAGAAEGLGLDRFTAGHANQESDFEPRSDIFENKDSYTIHLSLPGAKKEDIGVDYDGEHSVLRITGVVHRPGVDEKMLSELVVDGRKRETGVFEKAVRLGTKRDPANIDVAGISAKITDGVLVVKIPKVEKTHERREVPITASPKAADYEDDYSEKPVLFDAEEQAGVVGIKTPAVPREEISLIDMKDNEEKHVKEDTAKHIEKNTQAEPTEDSKAPDAGKAKEAEALKQASEQLPAYSAEHEAEHEQDEDWENFSDHSGEGEYIKIDIK